MIITIDTEKIDPLAVELLLVIAQRSGLIKGVPLVPWRAEGDALDQAAAEAGAREGEARANGGVTDPEEPGAVVEETAEPVAEEKPKRKRRTKAEMEAARAAEAAAEAEQDEPVQEAAPEPEAVSEAPKPVRETVMSQETVLDQPGVIQKFRDEAVAKATEMVAGGQRDKVVEALAAVGAKKVSQIADDKLAEFLGALKS